MDRVRAWLKQLRAALRPGRADREMQEELAFHLDQETARNLALGMPPDEARRAARVAFGAGEPIKDDLRTAGLRGVGAEAIRDLHHAARALRRRPSFAIAVVATLALGLGLSTAMFSVVHAVVLRPLPYPDSERLVAVWETYPHWRGRPVLGDQWDRIGLAWPDYERWRDAQQSFDMVAVFSRARMTSAGADGAEILDVGRSSGSLWALLGAAPLRGRTFAPDEAGPGAAPLAVLSYGFWQRRFGGAEDIVGRPLQLDGQVFSIIGVLAPAFRFPAEPGPDVDLWLPAGAAAQPLGEGNHAFSAIGRLRPSVPLDAAAEEAARLLRGDRPATLRGASLRPYLDHIVGAAGSPLLLLLAGTVLLLAIACVNAAALIAADTARRDREIATRHALGAARSRIIRQLATESLALALAASAAGLGLAAVGVPILAAFAPPDVPRVHEIALDVGAAAFTLVAASVVAVVCGAVAIGVAERQRPSHRLQAPARATGPGRRSQPVFIAIQLTLLTVLVTAAALLARSLFGVRAIETGFATSHLLTMVADVPPSRYPDRRQVSEYYRRLTDVLTALPGVIAVSGVSTGPFADGSESTSVGIEGLPANAAKLEMQRRVVLPSYFETMGIPVVDGARALAAGTRMVAVSEAMAARLWPGERAIGKRISLRDVWYEVAAVVGDIRDQALTTPPQGTYYVTLDAAREDAFRIRLLIRTRVDPAALASQARPAAAAVDTAVPIRDVATLDALMARSLAAERYRALLSGVFAGASLVLAAAGIFGVTWRFVRHRRRELGVRIALGARPLRLLGGTIGRMGAGAAAGLAVGLALAWAVLPVLSPYLHGLSARDTWTYAGAAGLLLLVSLTAALIPSQFAARMSVVDVLRED